MRRSVCKSRSLGVEFLVAKPWFFLQAHFEHDIQNESFVLRLNNVEIFVLDLAARYHAETDFPISLVSAERFLQKNENRRD